MMQKLMLLASLLLTTIASTVHAQPVDLKNDPAFKIQSMTVTEVEPLAATVELPKAPANPIDEIAIIMDGLIAIGKKIWPIIDAGRPVINTKLTPAISILPHLEGENGVLYQMANWSTPKVRSYRVSFKNGFNSEVVGFTYTLYFQYNGDYKAVGKYVANLKVQASDIYTAWGFNFDATNELIGISNVGSSYEPVASGIVQVAYTVKGLINEVRSAQSFYVDGAGNFQVLNN